MCPEVIEETETLRVRLELDEGHGPPDWDGQGYVILCPDYGGQIKVWHTDHGDPSEVFNLPHAIDRFGLDYDRIERYLRMFHETVSFDYTTPPSSVMFFVVTRAQAQHWGCPPEQWEQLASETCAAWRHFLEGEVYGYVIEEKTRWGRLDSDGELMWRLDSETFERWEHVYSCWGLYGRDHAEAEAIEAFQRLTQEAY